MYVQGMNELLAVIYYLFWTQDDSPDMQKFHESDCFQCFKLIMAELRDSFDRETDNEPTGIKGQIKRYG
jgi:hypothetical protein